MIAKCDMRITCPGSDWPITNYSSEDPDKEVFLGIGWGWWWVNDPVLSSDINNVDMPGCVIFSQSTLSQQDADACAENVQQYCADDLISPLDCTTDGGQPNPDGGGPSDGGDPVDPNDPALPKLYCNDVQTCTKHCPDGSPYAWTIEACAVVASSKGLANRMAKDAACKLADFYRKCNPPTGGGTCPRVVCEGDEVYEDFGLNDPSSIPMVYSADGLPPGLSMSKTGVLSGTVSAGSAGNYTSELAFRWSDTGGGFRWQVLWAVLGFTSNYSLARGRLTYPYSGSVKGGGGVPPLKFQWNGAGTFPPGLTLHEDGTITGTPTTAGTFTFGIILTSDCQGYCEDTFEIMIVDVGNAPITELRCSMPPYNNVVLTHPISEATFYGGPGTDQGAVDAQAYSAAIAASAADFAAAGCACYLTSYVIAGNNAMPYANDGCTIQVHGGNFVAGVWVQNPCGLLATINITNAGMGPPGDIEARFHDLLCGYGTGITTTLQFILHGAPVNTSSIIFVWHHSAH
jgi:hypothetical protein